MRESEHELDATGATLSETFAHLGVGRKAWRRLGAMLDLGEDAFYPLLHMWLNDRPRVQSALEAAMQKESCQAVTRRLDDAVLAQAAVEEEETYVPSCRRWSNRTHRTSQGNLDEQVVAVAGPSLAGVAARLPRTSLGRFMPEGQSERGRALRERLKHELPQATQVTLRTAAASLRVEGAPAAQRYVESVWGVLQSNEAAEELMAELICTQTSAAVQRALHTALTLQDATDPTTWQQPASHREPGAFALLCLPEPALFQVLSLSAGSPEELASLGACSQGLRVAAEADSLWENIWKGHAHRLAAVNMPRGDLRKQFLMHLACLCVECRCYTEFEHAITGSRLCEGCERSCPKYTLIRTATARLEYQLRGTDLQTLAHVDTATGRIYLRSAVESLAERLHSRQDLHRLRAERHVGVTSSGRQRRRPGPACQSKRNSNKFLDDDPCCFEATALRLANRT